MSIQVSVHHNCRWAGAERFHIRVTVTTEMVARFVEQVERYGIDEDHHDRIDTGHFLFNGKKFEIVDGEYDPRDEGGWVYFSVSHGSIQADFTPFQGGWNIDFSIQKEYGDDRDLDHMRYLNTGIEEELPECFWIEPASIVRAMLKA